MAIALLGWRSRSIAAEPKASKLFEDALLRYEKIDFPGVIIQLTNALQIDPNRWPVPVGGRAPEPGSVALMGSPWQLCA